MRIQLLSDLHLEVDPFFIPQPAPDADVLVLAGDIGALPDTPMARHGTPDWGLARFSPRLGAWPVPVLYVPGNHEFDGQDLDISRAALQALANDLGLVWLDREFVIINNVRFVGTTLWSDFDCFSDRPSYVSGAMTYNLRQREKAYRAANYYLEKALTMREGKLFDADRLREESLVCQTWLRAALAMPHDGKTVVVTHFAPSLKSHDPRFGLTPGTAGFCNALDDLIDSADVWLHGHLHCPSDYQVGKCRVVANPLGYAEQGEQATFNPQCVIEV